ncbi:MAG: T9SS type A sorting domain-containing protein [Paludibacter sp.]
MKTKLLFIACACMLSLVLSSQTTSFPGSVDPWLIDDFQGDIVEAGNWVLSDGGTKEIVVDPYDPTNYVLKFTRKEGGLFWGGVIRNFNLVDPTLVSYLPGKYQIGTTGLPKYRYLVMRLLKTTPEAFFAKVEYKDASSSYSSEQTPIDATIKVGEWKSYVFDLTNIENSRKGYDLAANNDKNQGYNVFFIVPDISTAGGKDVTYIDDISFTNSPFTALPKSLVSNPYNMFIANNQLCFELNNSEKVDVKLYDISGRKLAIILNQVQAAGLNKVTLPEMKSGVYIFELKTSTGMQSFKYIK